MSRVYAIREDNQKRILVALKCDDCEAEIKPNPDIASSGWMKRGTDYGPGDERNAYTSDYCPACWDRRTF